jgi:uncharacterized protein YlxW (UPF0749 family)
LQAKIVKLTADMSQLERQMGKVLCFLFETSIDNLLLFLPKGITKTEKEDKLKLEAALDEINMLQNEMSNLNQQVKQLSVQLDKKKKELALAKKMSLAAAKRSNAAPPVSSQTKPEIEIVAGPNPRQSNAIVIPFVQESSTNDTTNWAELARKLKSRLE